MKTHTTNYTNAFILVADDCPITKAEMPPAKDGKKSVATMQFDMLYENPYKYTSDDVLFTVYADRNAIPENERPEAREQFFSKGQACFRASPLTKRYGWGVHHNAEGQIAIYPVESEAYATYAADASLNVVKAMRSSK